jgi:hypothetical protein
MRVFMHVFRARCIRDVGKISGSAKSHQQMLVGEDLNGLWSVQLLLAMVGEGVCPPEVACSPILLMLASMARGCPLQVPPPLPPHPHPPSTPPRSKATPDL